MDEELDFQLDDAPDRTSEHESPIFRIKNRLRKNEGYSTNMYLDKKGLVSVGIGFRIDPISLMSPFKLKWLDRETKKRADDKDVEAEWRSVKKLTPGKPSDWYRQAHRTHFDLSQGTISLEFARRVDEMLNSLREQFLANKKVDFDRLPLLIQEAVCDLAWNAGWNDFTGKTDPETRKVKGWPKLSDAISEGLWDEAAFQTMRKGEGISDERRYEFRDRILEELHISLWRAQRQR